MPHVCLHSVLFHKYEERQEALDKLLLETFKAIKKEYELDFANGYMRLGKLMIPLDSNYSRLSPYQCNIFFPQLVLIVDTLYLKVLEVKPPFKMVHQRPFTYMISRLQLESPRPRLYPLEFPEAPEHQSSADRMRKLYRRFLVGLSMLNFNIVRLVSFFGISVSRAEEGAQPLKLLERLFSHLETYNSIEEYKWSDFNEILRNTILQWNQQTGSNLLTNQRVLLYNDL